MTKLAVFTALCVCVATPLAAQTADEVEAEPIVPQLRRASCRERVSISVVAVALKKQHV